MKKIRLVDGAEYEINAISDAYGNLQISMLDVDASEMEKVFLDADNLAAILYYVGTDLMKGYARYTVLSRYEKKMNQLISIDYTVPDETTESGFAETRAATFTVVLCKAVDNSTEALAERVDALEEDVSAINTALGGTE